MMEDLMRNCMTAVIGVVLISFAAANAQAPDRIRVQAPNARPEPEVRIRTIFNPVFATGMKCNGATDDSLALRASLAFAASALGNATVIMPPGTCIIDPGARVAVN